MMTRMFLLLTTALLFSVPAVNGHAGPFGLLPVGANTALTNTAILFPSSPAAGQQGPSLPASAPPEPAALLSQPQAADYADNLKSDAFGANLFTGAFAGQGTSQFNPDYVIAIGDKIQVRLWGSFVYDAMHTVDPQGNVFLPNIGPVKVLGVRNKELQRVVEESVAKFYRSNVSSYASLATAQPVRVFVGGYVNRPGLYGGTSMASLLYYLDQAGGIDPERGSFLNVQVKRGDEVRATVNLYEFLLEGRMPLIQFSEGDVIFVNPRQNIVRVMGLAENTKRFEFSDTARTVADLIRIAKPFPIATHVRVTRNSGSVKNIEYYPLTEAGNVSLQNGDGLEFTADKKTGTITVRVEGEHMSPQEYVLPNGSRLGDLLNDRVVGSRIVFFLQVREHGDAHEPSCVFAKESRRL